MRTLVARTGNPSPLVLVLLSGTYSEPEDFVRQGFVEAVEARGIAAEVVMAQTRAAYFSDGSIVRRIRDHVVVPARERGGERVWMTGLSLGALAALAYVARHGRDVERLALLSPYPGTREVLREIDAAGGLAAWTPPRLGEDAERDAWSWLRRADGSIPVECHFASGDRFAEGQRRITRCLPQAAVHEVAGGHEWKDWRGMWIDFLTRNAP